MDDKKKIEEALSESEIQEKKLRAAKAARKRKKRIKSIIGWLVVILIVSLVLIWFLKMKKDSEAQIEALKNMNSQIEATVEKSTYDREIDISGYVVPFDTLEAKFRSTGAVTGVYVSEGDYVKEGQVVIDVGINVNEEGKLCGDVNYDDVESVVEAITPVPGGVGSVTTSVLVSHVVEAAIRKMQ